MNHVVDAGPVNVAVFEEEVLLRECLCRVFESQGMHVVRARSEASQFLEQLSADDPDVILWGLSADRTDVNLHELHGAAPGVSVVLVGAHLTPTQIDASLRAGAFAFVDRTTADPEDLVAAVLAAARKQPHSHPHAHRAAMESVSPREREVLRHIAIGSDNLKIAAQLSISERTVKAHVSSLYRKLGCENRTQMAILARELVIWSGESPEADSSDARVDTYPASALHHGR